MIYVCDACGGKTNEPLETLSFGTEFAPISLCSTCRDADEDANIGAAIQDWFDKLIG